MARFPTSCELGVGMSPLFVLFLSVVFRVVTARVVVTDDATKHYTGLKIKSLRHPEQGTRYAGTLGPVNEWHSWPISRRHWLDEIGSIRGGGEIAGIVIGSIVGLIIVIALLRCVFGGNTSTIATPAAEEKDMTLSPNSHDPLIHGAPQEHDIPVCDNEEDDIGYIKRPNFYSTVPQTSIDDVDIGEGYMHPDKREFRAIPQLQPGDFGEVQFPELAYRALALQQDYRQRDLEEQASKEVEHRGQSTQQTFLDTPFEQTPDMVMSKPRDGMRIKRKPIGGHVSHRGG